MTQLIRRSLISVLCACALGACATQSSFVTIVGPKVRQAATGKCLMDANVIIAPAVFVEDSPLFRGVSIGGGYVITDASAVRDKDDLSVAIERDGVAGLPRVHAKVIEIDKGADIALLKIDGEPACDAVLADMRGVKTSQEVHVPIMDGLDKGSILEPHAGAARLGGLNAFMRLSWAMHGAPQGSGIYAEDGTLVGMRVLDTINRNNVVALPADRIARFLRDHHVSYMQYDHQFASNGPVFTRVD